MEINDRVQSNLHSVTSKTTAQITVNAETLLRRSCNSWNSIRLLHTAHGQTRMTPRQRHFGLKCSITKTAVETRPSKNLPSLLRRCLRFLQQCWCQTSVFTNEPGQVQTEEQNGTRHTQQHTPHKIWTEKTRYMLQRLHLKQRDAPAL